jgi:hypothetical protein
MTAANTSGCIWLFIFSASNDQLSLGWLPSQETSFIIDFLGNGKIF